MRRRDDKIARAAHIKERTHGTSNEISFSVLDAAKYKETTQRFSLRDLLADRRDTNTQSVSRETGEHVSRETSNHRALAGSHAAESGARRRRSGVWFKRKSAKQATQRNKATHASGYSEEASSQTPAGAKRMSIEQEIARRKARRRKGRIAAVSVVVAASLVIVSVGVWAWHCQVTEQQGYESELMDALRLVSEADETIL